MSVTLKSLPVRAALRDARRGDVASAAEPEVGEAKPVEALAALPEARLLTAQAAPAAVGATTERSGATLIRTVQKELRRVGCYDGAIDGAWDRSTRSAMSGFLDRVNAALPTTAPDPAMLALLRGQRQPVCGESCPRGQGMTEAGRCMPHAIVAKEARRRGPAAPHDAVASNDAVPAVAPFTTTVTRGEMKPSRDVAQIDPRVSVQRPPPLPGRMAIGGPVTARVAPAEQGWWEKLMGGGDAIEPPAPRPVARGNVRETISEPRLVRNGDTTGRSNRVASVEAAQNGASDGTGLQSGLKTGLSTNASQNSVAEQTTPERPRASRRKASKSKASRARYASRRPRGRNVQAMFQHPLGRM